jgi:hypothetical protein
MSDLKKKPENNNEYDYDLDLNWRDDGDVLHDSSMNDYLKGYQLDPYAFQQWSMKKEKNIKNASKEVMPMQFTPKYLANYILSFWDNTDGTLQAAFDGFTLRYNNQLKQAIAEELRKNGYTIYPTLTDDRAIYASRIKSIFEKSIHANVRTKLAMCKVALKKSEALDLCFGEFDDIAEIGQNITDNDASNLLDYYSEIFPEDYAIDLTTNFINNKVKNIEPEHYQDFNLTDDSLNEIEKMLSGNQNPYYDVHDGGGQGSFGWDYITDMRGFDGTRPEQYEHVGEVNPKKKE